MAIHKLRITSDHRFFLDDKELESISNYEIKGKSEDCDLAELSLTLVVHLSEVGLNHLCNDAGSNSRQSFDGK